MLNQLWSEAVNSIEKLTKFAEFNQFDFPSWESEESIIILKGVKNDFSSLEVFWLSCIIETIHPAFKEQFKTSGFPEDLNNADITRLEVYQYQNSVKKYAEVLKKPIPEILLNPQKYVSGKHVYMDWNDEWIIANHSEYYWALRWWMTA